MRAHVRKPSKSAARHLGLGLGAVAVGTAALMATTSAPAQASPLGATSTGSTPELFGQVTMTQTARAGLVILPTPGVSQGPLSAVQRAAARSAAVTDPSITPSGWYTPVRHYAFSARFGEPGPWQSGHHTGLDFMADEGTPIRAAANGVVVSAQEEGAYGNLVKIRVRPGVEVWTAHMQVMKVKKGDHVGAGQLIGRVGMTGNTTGPHCHFEVRVKGKYKDPEHFFWPDGHSVSKVK